MKKQRILYLSFLLGSALAYAETESSVMQKSYLETMPIDKFVDVFSLDELLDVVVTENKVAQKLDTLTQKTTVITDTQFEQLTTYNRNISEILKYAPGQFVNVLSRNDANWGSYGGLGPKYNTYMVDGLPVDSFADSMSLDPWAFERVESQRGPASVLYSNYLTMDFAGNEAPLAGTTNFILKERIDTSMTRVQLGGGSYNTYNGRVYHQDKKDDFSYFFGGSFENSDYTQYGSEDSWLQTVENPDYSDKKVYGKMMFDLGEDGHKISIFAHHSENKGDLGRPNRDFDHKYNTVNISYNNPISNSINLLLKAGYRDYDRIFDSDYYSASLAWKKRSYTQQKIVPVDMTFTYNHGDGGLLSIGADAQWAEYNTKTFQSGVTTKNNDVSALSTGYFIQEKLVLEQWVLRAGLRHYSIEHDYDLLGDNIPSVRSASWSETLWNLGVRYNASKEFALYANIGSSFMAPSAKQIGGTIADINDSGQVPNPGLSQENGLGSDIGLDYHPNDRLNIGLRAFYNVVSDAIVDNVFSTTPSQTKAVNAGDTTTLGVELELKHKFSNEQEWFANVTYTSSKVENPTVADEDGAEIPFVPDMVINAGFTSRLFWDVTASAYLQSVGTYYDSTSKSNRQEFGSYSIVNLKLLKSLKRTTAYALSVNVELNNITDKEYEMPWDFTDPGFNGYAGIQIVF